MWLSLLLSNMWVRKICLMDRLSLSSSQVTNQTGWWFCDCPFFTAIFTHAPSERSVGQQMDFFSFSFSSFSFSFFSTPPTLRVGWDCAVLYCAVPMERPGPAKLILLKLICLESLTSHHKSECRLLLSLLCRSAWIAATP